MMNVVSRPAVSASLTRLCMAPVARARKQAEKPGDPVVGQDRLPLGLPQGGAGQPRGCNSPGTAVSWRRAGRSGLAGHRGSRLPQRCSNRADWRIPVLMFEGFTLETVDLPEAR